MASDDLDVPQIALVGERLTLDASSATSATNSVQPTGRTSPPFDFLSLPASILRNSPNYLDVPTSLTLHLSDPSLYPPPSRPLSVCSSSSNRWVTSTELRNENPEENDSLSSLGLLTSPSQGHRRKIVSSIGSSTTNRDNSSRYGRSGISEVPSTQPFPTNTHVDAGSDTLRLSLAASFFKRTVQCIRRLSPSPSAETDMGSETTREAGLNIEPFAFKPFLLANLIYPKRLENLERLGGVNGLLRGLGTNHRRGLSTKLTQLASRGPEIINSVHPDSEKPDTIITSPSPSSVPEGLQSTAGLEGGSGAGDPASLKFSARAYEATIQDRQRIYGHYIPPQRPTKSLLLFMWLALQDKVLVLLLIAAVISFTLGLFQDFRTSRPQEDHPMDWVEGVAIIAAILVVVAVGSLNDWQKERQFQVLDEKKEGRLVKVIRDGEERQIGIHQVVVGDVVLLELGEVAPCDGVFLSGHNVSCDESSATGESDAIKKLSYDECIALRDKRLLESDPDGPSGNGESVSAPQRTASPSGLESLEHADCFIVSGSKVLAGVGSYVVISVGTKNFNGRIVTALQRDSENTPLRLKLDDLSEIIAKIGSVAEASFSLRFSFVTSSNSDRIIPRGRRVKRE